MDWFGVFIVVVLLFFIPTPYNFVLLPGLLFLRLATWADDSTPET